MSRIEAHPSMIPGGLRNRRHLLIIAGLAALILWVLMRIFGGESESSARFGGALLNEEALQSLSPEQRLCRVQIELERRVRNDGEVLTRVNADALPLLVLHRHEDAVLQRGFADIDDQYRTDLQSLVEAYRTIGLSEMADTLQHIVASGGESPTVLHQRWMQACQLKRSRAAQSAYLDTHLTQILESP
jgi:hypothetical protein